MNDFEKALSYRKVGTQRTCQIIDGPFCDFDKTKPREANGKYPVLAVWYDVLWDDTGDSELVDAETLEKVEWHIRHITDGVRPCWCGAAEIDGVVVHNTIEALN